MKRLSVFITVGLLASLLAQLVPASAQLTKWTLTGAADIATLLGYTPASTTSPTFTSGIIITNTATTDVGLTVNGFAAQTNDLIRVTAGGTNTFKFTGDGTATLTPQGTNTSTFRINHAGGTARFQFGVLSASAPEYACLWMGSVSPTTGNYALQCDGGANTVLNTPTAGTILLRSANNTTFSANTSTVTSTPNFVGTLTVKGTTGFISTSTDAPVAITATGWTNSFSKEAEVWFVGTNVTYTIANNAGTSIRTNITGTGVDTLHLLLQTGGKMIVTIGTVVGSANPF